MHLHTENWGLGDNFNLRWAFARNFECFPKKSKICAQSSIVVSRLSSGKPMILSWEFGLHKVICKNKGSVYFLLLYISNVGNLQRVFFRQAKIKGRAILFDAHCWWLKWIILDEYGENLIRSVFIKYIAVLHEDVQGNATLHCMANYTSQVRPIPLRQHTFKKRCHYYSNTTCISEYNLQEQQKSLKAMTVSYPEIFIILLTIIARCKYFWWNQHKAVLLIILTQWVKGF